MDPLYGHEPPGWRYALLGPKGRKSWLTVHHFCWRNAFEQDRCHNEGQVGCNKILAWRWQMHKPCKELVVLLVCRHDAWLQSRKLPHCSIRQGLKGIQRIFCCHPIHNVHVSVPTRCCPHQMNHQYTVLF